MVFRRLARMKDNIASLLKKYSIESLILLICLLLVVDFFQAELNDQRIQDQLAILRQSSEVKVEVIEVIRTIHDLDLGIRGYALTQSENMGAPIPLATRHIHDVLPTLEGHLKRDGFDLKQFYPLRDSISNYFGFVGYLKQLVDEGNHAKFLDELNKDRGLNLWYSYERISQLINDYEEGRMAAALEKYNRARVHEYWIHTSLFLVIIPVLVYLAHHTRKSIKLSQRLHQSEVERNVLLTNQRDALEEMVKKATHEIGLQNIELQAANEELAASNEELQSSNEELVSLNEQLYEANQTIEERTAALQQAIEKEKELVELKSRFVSIASHEFRTPLSTIALSSGYLRKYKERMSAEDFDKKLATIDKQIHHMTGLLEDVLLVGRLEQNRLQADLTEFDVQTEFDVFVKELNLAQHTHQIQYDFQGEQHPFLSDEKLLRKIVHNLVMNAIKFSPERDVVRLDVKQSKSGLVFVVQDFGIGISRQDQKNLFVPFYRGENARTIQGTGLGLSIVKKAVELLHGEISVTSEMGKGTSITVNLPYLNDSQDLMVN